MAPGWILLMTLVIAQPQSPARNTAEQPEPAPARHVRSTATWILDLLQQGESTSTTFRQLLNALDETDVIVYIEPGVCAFGHFHACLPAVVSTAGALRYLRVLIDRGRTPRPALIALIGHELQHTLEVAEAPTVKTGDDVRGLFRRIGRPGECPKGVPDCFETSAGRRAGQLILEELQRQ
jgi:hypothetical protein